MKDSSVMKFCSALPVLMLAGNLSYAMPGMHRAEGSGVTEPPAASKDMGTPINSSGSEIEITYSADGKTAIFVSTREGSVESPGTAMGFFIAVFATEHCSAISSDIVISMFLVHGG